MRPHRLTFAALGSFPGEVEVDFDSLSPYGLFHIHGPTGAGKSSLLDALCFALYGTIPGPRLSDGMRSHHAEPSVETRASLDFSVESTTWRVIRTPTQRRGKRRGSGTTEQRATATLLRRMGSSWNPVASGVKEVDAIIYRLIGLDADQFMQVVVLPQGSFQRALRAGSAERERLMSTLFHTERFGFYTDHLKQRAAELTRERDLRVTNLSGIAARIRERASTLGIAIEEAPALDTQTVLTFEAIATQATSLANERQQDLERAERDHRELSTAMRDLTVRFEAGRKRRDAVEKFRHLESMASEMEAQHELVERILELAPLRSQFERVERQRRQMEPLDIRRQRLLADLAEKVHTLPPFASELATAIEAIPQSLDRSATDPRVGDLRITAPTSANPRASGPRMAVEQIAFASALCRDLAVKLGGLADRHNEAVQLRAELQQHERVTAGVEERQLELIQLLEKTRAETDTITGYLQEAKAAAVVVDDLQREATHLQSLVDAGRELALLQKEEEQHEQQWRTSEHRSIAAQREHLALLRKRLGAMAAVLASHLTHGQPCAVCGSCEHPAPVSSDEPLIEEQVIADAETKAESAIRTAKLHHEHLLELRTRRGAIAALAGPAANDLVGVEHHLLECREALTRASSASQVVASHEARLTTLDSEASHLDRERAQRAEELAARRSVATTMLERLHDLEESITATVGAHSDPDSAAEQINSISVLLDQLSKVIETRALVEDEWQHEQTTLNEMLHSSSIADVRTCAKNLHSKADETRFTRARPSLTRGPGYWAHRANHEPTDNAATEVFAHVLSELSAQTMSDAEMRRLRRELEDYDRALAGARSVVDQFDDVPEVEPERLSRTEMQLATATEHLRRATEEHARVRAEAAAIRELVSTFQTEQSEVIPFANEAERVYQLAAICNGDRLSERRMSLERYVLAAYLEEVAAVASHRLRLMTSGRYTLHHSDARARGNAASGLSLIVHDAYTGGEREVSTLSGGETFLASLALALGVADVVQQHAGGVSVDALFIDEGFGSLDPDTLELALAELDRLREGGRLVGVISHVSALQQRIPVGIEVIPGHHGSQIRLSIGPSVGVLST